MYHLIKSKAAAAANQGGAMETGDHFKNGVISKNHKSRRNFLRIFAFIFALCSVFVACSDDNNDELEELRRQLEAEKNKTATGVSFAGGNMIIAFSNGTSATMAIPDGLQGPQGSPGNGIESITYNPATGVMTITMTNGNISNFAISSNGGSNEKIQLLEYIIFVNAGSGNEYIKLEYDYQNRIKKWQYRGVYTHILNYNGDGFLYKKVVIDQWGDETKTYEFEKLGNTITVTEKGSFWDSNDWEIKEYTDIYTIDLDNEGYPIKFSGNKLASVFNFQFHEGNLLNFSKFDNELVYDFKYDDNKSPFYHCKTPKWYMFLFVNRNNNLNDLSGADFLGNKNNVTEMTVIDWGDDYKTYFRYRLDSAGFPITRTAFSSGEARVVEFIYK